MATPIVGRETIPQHLPKRLTISFWFSYWATDIEPGEGYADLEQTFKDLVARGYNTVRIDGLWSWCFKPDGSPRGPVEIGRLADPGYCDFGAGTVTRGGGKVDVLARLMLLLELARKYNVYVALTSWEYQPGHSLGFLADDALRQEILDIPVEERFPYTSMQIDRQLNEIKAAGYGDRIAYVELHNEICISLGLGLPGGLTNLRHKVEAEIAFLRERHPDLLITDDHTLPCAQSGFDYNMMHDFQKVFAHNTQLIDHHLYAWDASVQVALFREAGTGIGQGNLDEAIPRLIEENTLYRWLLKPDYIPWEEYKTHFSNDWLQQWWAPIYLYQNMDVDKWDYWMFTHYPQYENRMRGFWSNAIAMMTQLAKERNVPLVCDEGYMCWPPTNSKFEPSAVGRANFEFIMDRMLEAGYWGFMVNNYAFPTQPIWDDDPQWLAKINQRILNAD